ncbi:normocyte-binding protein [Brevibacillus laterosporus]|uniref:Normocyte-binding protein n=1 Tax=Brevibacillus laterosporus TaxID=1465 RepID=A0A518V7J0_BRELA|nr:normocyte-binding protein [Brevibacillus laterosporus]QDX92966.1 normocyte-binding protein [Brevibacillus laterosporus]TPG71323.1 normocyte-binding protein [Brevibacillus laterosporus]
MKDIILDRLNKLEDLDQRRMLKQLMTGVFVNLVEYQEEMNSKLEKRVFGELEDQQEKHDVYVTICSKDDWDPIHDYLYPMLPEDTLNKTCDMNSLVTQLNKKEEARLFTLFLQCDYPTIKQLLNNNRVFTGKLTTATNTKLINVRLEQNRTYMKEIEQLYTVFQKNSVPWKTVNNPYAYKFFDVILTGCDEQLDESEEILEITVDLEEWESCKRLDKIPLWNIQRLQLKNSGFPTPAMDRVNFEHVLSLRKTGTDHGYLVDGEEENIRYIKRTHDELTIVSPQEKAGIWDVLKIMQPVESKIGKLEYPLVSNKRIDSFLARYARKQAMIVRAKGEIIRIVHSFETADMLELVQVEILEAQRTQGHTYEMNPFISDNVRVERDKKIMRLCFRNRAHLGDTSFILHDLMSFLVSEVQMSFPEYKCEGEWA